MRMLTLISSQGSLIQEVLNARSEGGQSVGAVAQEEVLHIVDAAGCSNKAWALYSCHQSCLHGLRGGCQSRLSKGC